MGIEGPMPSERERLDSDENDKIRTIETLVDDMGNPTEDIEEGVYQIEEDDDEYEDKN